MWVISGIGAKLKVKKVRTQYSDDDDDAYSDDSERGADDDEDSGPIVGFFNEAMTEELMSMQGCSKKKAQQIMAVRPFTNWDDLVSRSSTNVAVVVNCKMLQMPQCQCLFNELMT